jgi:hypothetical protein
MRVAWIMLLTLLLAWSSEYANAAEPGPASPIDKAAAARCHQARMSMVQKAIDLTGQYRSGCQVNSDCTLVSTSLSCQENCPMAILGSNRDNYEKALKTIERAACAAENKICNVGFFCAPAVGAACFEGHCVVDFKGVPLRR